MAYIRTCTGCAFEGQRCAERDKLRASIRGLGITSVKHRCNWRRDRFRFGQPVTVTTAAFIPEEEEWLVLARFPATFIQYTGAKCVCFIAPGDQSECGQTFSNRHDEDGGYVKVPRQRVKARDGLAAPTCRRCGSAVSGKCQWWDGRCPHRQQPQQEAT